MAFIISNRFPVDTLPDVAVGVSIPFNGKAVFNQTYITRDQIKSNLINFFLTNRGERYLNPRFGGNLRATLFESITSGNLDSLKTQIQDQLTLLFPTLVVENLKITTFTEEHLVNIFLEYKVLNQSLDEIEINFNTDGI